MDNPNPACVQGSTNGTNGIPISFKVLPMIIPLVPMVMQMEPLVSQWYHWEKPEQSPFDLQLRTKNISTKMINHFRVYKMRCIICFRFDNNYFVYVVKLKMNSLYN